MAHVEIFSNSQGLQADKVKIVTNIWSPAGVGPLKELESRIATAAIHDSAERCDAPKCQPETRVAVQDDLYDWLLNGDGALESEQPRKVKWATGPAGCGKTAIMGSLAGRCATNGVLGATFFFASWSATPGRRRKGAFVTTIAHQLALYRDDLKDAIAYAIERNPTVFDKNLHVQMEILVSAPLREVAAQEDRPRLRQGAIIIDGVDECDAEQYHDQSNASSFLARTKEQDQLEILEVLQAASSDPSFPFRILIASRPERVFRNFFDPENTPTPFADKLDLHEQYNADADITLFFEVQFNRLRRRYNFTSLMASPRYDWDLETPHKETPKALLDAILETGATRRKSSNPLEQLDALYARILESSPDPELSVRWIRSINALSWSSASNLDLLLQTDPENNEAEHVLGNLHSLIRIPPPSDQAGTKYGFYHKSLFDFPRRCGRVNHQKLFVEWDEIQTFMWDRFVQACMRACDGQFSFPDSFPGVLVAAPATIAISVASSHSKTRLTPACAAWWVSLAITHQSNRYPSVPSARKSEPLIKIVRKLVDHAMRRNGKWKDKKAHWHQA
ncbi:hypothetical protein MD484_g3090, partial [Candolleomyces efflorescens]